MNNHETSLLWFRQDLRLSDNAALAGASKSESVVPVFIFDTSIRENDWPVGSAAKWWLHHSIESLSKSLGGMVFLQGDPKQELFKLARSVGATSIHWNRCYEPAAIKRDTEIKSELRQHGLAVESHKGSLLFEPWEIANQSGAPFKVYSHFWKKCLEKGIQGLEKFPPDTNWFAPNDIGLKLHDLKLLPTKPDWADGFAPTWQPGEKTAQQRLHQFIENGLPNYRTLRDRPDMPHVSRLSPHLHWGEISPRQVWHVVQQCMASRPELVADGEKFLAELGWREFAYHLLYQFPDLPHRNWRSSFDAYPWNKSGEHLRAWQRGKTGYPLVDAGMRELWHTGYMHNRVRMVVASFLTKHLRIHWKQGEEWFWDTLLDADLANNAASWQWVAGSGADAAPYFRIFNPTEQARKFDPNGDYIRRWCPELSLLSNQHIHAPFDAPDHVLSAANVVLGSNYPRPIVDHKTARTWALSGYQSIRA